MIATESKLVIETHHFKHRCESGNRFFGVAAICRNLETKKYIGKVAWSSHAEDDLTFEDYLELTLGFEIEAALTMQKITGVEMRFKPRKKYYV